MAETDAPTLRAGTEMHVREDVLPHLSAWQRQSDLPREAFQRAGAHGLCGCYVASDYGGSGLDAASVAPTFELLGAADPTYALAVSVHNFVALAVTSSGGPGAEQWGRDLAAGTAIGGFLMTEPAGGSDPVRGVSTRAVPSGEGYRLSGRKSWVTFAGVADVYAVVCRTGPDPNRGASDMMMVLVHADDPGVHVREVYEKPTGSFIPIGEVEFDDVPLSSGRVLAEPGAGLHAALAAIDTARVHVAAVSVGTACAALDAALRHAGGRELFGRPALDLQANLFSLSDIETNIHAARLMYEYAADRTGQPGGSVAAAHAKRFATDMAVDAAVAAARVMGADGSLVRSSLPRYLAGAQFLTMADGSQSVQRLVIGRELSNRLGSSL